MIPARYLTFRSVKLESPESIMGYVQNTEEYWYKDRSSFKL